MPFIVRWPGNAAPGSVCDELVCLSDLMASCADLVGARLPDNAGEDSVNILPLLRGTGHSERQAVIHHSIDGKFAIRDGRWKLVLCPGSGGWTLRDADAAKAGLPLVQLCDMQADPGEVENLHTKHPERVRQLVALLKKQVDAGRSTPGQNQANDAQIDIWKLETMPDVDASVIDDY